MQAGSLDSSNPGAARLDVAFYFLPGEEPAVVQAAIEARLHSLADRYRESLLTPLITWNGRVMPPAATPADDPFVRIVATVYEKAAGKSAIVNGMPMSDFFQFKLHSPRPMSTVAMGPGRWGVTGGAHQPNESILIDEHLIPFVKTLALLIYDWCGAVHIGTSEPG